MTLQKLGLRLERRAKIQGENTLVLEVESRKGNEAPAKGFRTFASPSIAKYSYRLLRESDICRNRWGHRFQGYDILPTRRT